MSLNSELVVFSTTLGWIGGLLKAIFTRWNENTSIVGLEPPESETIMLSIPGSHTELKTKKPPKVVRTAVVGHYFRLVFLCIFGLTLLCIFIEVGMAVALGEFTTSQANAAALCNTIAKAGAGAMFGLIGGKALK